MTADVESGGAPAPAPGEAEVLPGEADAWRAVLAAWEDESSHRAYLASFTDLDGLAAAGRRYRDVLAERPGDVVALRWRDEVVKRATVAGLAALPRSRLPGDGLPRGLKIGIAVAAVAAMLGGFAVYVVRALDLFSRGRP